MNFIKKILRTDLFKVTSLNSVSVLLRIGTGLITSKLLAVFVGPSGMALVGNLRNFSSSLESVTTLGFQSGVVKYVAEYKEDQKELQKIISTVFISLLLVAVVSSFGLYFFADFWNRQIFGDHFEYEMVFKVTALVLPWYAISIFLISVLNGLGKFKKVIWANILGNAIGLLVSIYMILNFQTLGALLSIVISPSLLFFVSFYFINKEFPFFTTVRSSCFDFQIIKKLSSYSLMALVSAVLGPLVFLAIRKNVILVVGLEQAGFWETITRISTYYMMFVSTILTVYFFPKLAAVKKREETKAVFWSYYRNIFPLFIVALIIVYLARFFIIQLLFTKEFLPVTSLFFWQLIGDFFKAAALILGFQFLAKKMTTAFILSEIASFALFYILSLYLVPLFGVEGVVMAQAFNYIVYFLVLVVCFRRSLFD